MDFGWTLLNSAVLQRNAANVSDHRFSGTASANGKLLLRVSGAKGIVPGFAAREVGKASGGKLSGRITGLPTGGAYRLDFFLVNAAGNTVERLRIKDVLVGDLWLMAGQSNMQGEGYLPGLTPRHPMLHNFYMDNRWGVSKDPLHNLEQAAAPVHGGKPDFKLGKKLRGVGPGMSFAAAMWEATKVPQGTIACAHGGTSMSQWSPDLLDKGGWSLYGAMMERFHNLGGKVAGMIWCQGGNDSDPDNAPLYETRMRDFLKAVRRDTKQRDLPVVIAQLSACVTLHASPEARSQVRFAQYEIGRTTPHTACIAEIDLAMDDCLHLSSASQQIAGQRMAQAMLRLCGDKSQPAPMEAVSARVAQDPATGNANVTVTFRNVVGKLVAHGEPSGFFTPEAGHFTGEECFRADLCGNRVVVHTNISARLADRFILAYGAGSQPHANLRDESGRAVPCFTLPLRKMAENATEMVSAGEVSEPVYGPEDVETLSLPEHPEKLHWSKAKFTDFYLEHPERKKLATTDTKVFYFRFRTELPESMTLKVRTGSDGPFALFCDGKPVRRVFTINPLLIDEFEDKITLPKGKHEWYFAMSSNTGHAWGVCCRFVRPGKGALPVIQKW